MKLYEDTFAKYQGQLLGKYNELNTKLEDHFQSVFKEMQADTRKEFERMQKKFSKKEKKLEEAFQKSKLSTCPYLLNWFMKIHEWNSATDYPQHEKIFELVFVSTVKLPCLISLFFHEARTYIFLGQNYWGKITRKTFGINQKWQLPKFANIIYINLSIEYNECLKL